MLCLFANIVTLLCVDEDIGTMLDRMEERQAQLQSVSDYMHGVEEAHNKTQETVQRDQERLQTVESELSLLRDENKILTGKLEVRNFLSNDWLQRNH